MNCTLCMDVPFITREAIHIWSDIHWSKMKHFPNLGNQCLHLAPSLLPAVVQYGRAANDSFKDNQANKKRRQEGVKD
ncbi:hypothetical protein GDO78_003406 [Eleutherodactylus coqui]|uniref:Uncharacterized protein n=1 Tax=Eleutherodactylus coqui TaxID=57060 RepID=A0A8J6ES75_ELECQ|nr:hypothetical protein GDO78_003406 [Eleutherodactylus coqui]